MISLTDICLNAKVNVKIMEESITINVYKIYYNRKRGMVVKTLYA